MNDLLATLRREIFAALRPPPRIALDHWIPANVRLPATVAAESGPMRLFPWQVEVARSIENPAVDRVTIQKSARVGATQLMVAGIAHFAVNDPALQLVVMPSESDVKMLMTAVVEPTFEASPALRGALLEDTTGRDTMLSRHYPGGRLNLVSGASPKNLRARTARVLWLDEVDGLDTSAGSEGDPVSLAIRRTMTFGTSRKIVMASSPLDEGTSRIARAYSEGDCRVWELPCPAGCGEWHEVTWRMIQWPKGQPEKAALAFPCCGAVVEDRDRIALISRGRWRATRPEITDHHSYRLSTFGASTLAAASWCALAVEFVKASKDPLLLKVWVNTVAGETWKDDAPETLAEDELARFAAPISLQPIPEDCLILTAGVDLQHDRAEATICAWGEGPEISILDHVILWGNIPDPAADVWGELDEFLRSTFPHQLGGRIGISATCVDCGDGQTMQTAMRWAGPRVRQKILPIKGIQGQRPPIERAHRSKHGPALWLTGVDTIKTAIFEKARAGQIRFSDKLGPEWAAQFCSERRVLRVSGGQPKHVWERIPGRRAEALDAATYAVAARHIIPPPDFEALRLQLAGRAHAPAARQIVFHSPFVRR